MNTDPFALRTDADKIRARMTSLAFGELTGAVLRTAGVLVDMPETDGRRRFAVEYLGLMQTRLDEREEQVAALQQTAPSFTGGTGSLFELYFPASHEMRRRHGASPDLQAMVGLLATERNMDPEFNPEDARLAQQAMDVVDSVLTRQIIGDPTPEQ